MSFHDQCCWDNRGRCIFCHARRVKRYAKVALLGVLLVLASLAGCASAPALDVADPRAVIARVEHVAPLMASELIAMCVPPSDDFETRRHCDALRAQFNYLVAGGELP